MLHVVFGMYTVFDFGVEGCPAHVRKLRRAVGHLA